MKKYIHKVNYYETDKMGITHHSNYIRWMEEARIDFLEQIGFSYDKLEKEGAKRKRICDCFCKMELCYYNYSIIGFELHKCF